MDQCLQSWGQMGQQVSDSRRLHGGVTDIMQAQVRRGSIAGADLQAGGVARQGRQVVEGVAHNGEHGGDADAHADEDDGPEAGVLLSGRAKWAVKDDAGRLQGKFTGEVSLVAGAA